MLSARARRFALTLHITCSVGWLGAVVAFLAIAIAGLTSQDAQTVRGAYLVMELTGWSVLVPLAVASFVTGVVQSLGSKWGLLRHYWVLMKLGINVLATAVLVVYTQTLAALADVAATAGDDVSGVRSGSPVLHAGAALILLLAAAVLSVYKPKGVTRYGWRKQQERRRAAGV